MYRRGIMSVNSFENYPLTWRPDKTKLTRPLYKSLTHLLKQDILSGKLKKNTRLPSQRELSDYLDIHFTTVGQAYKYGVAIGLLYTNIGSGTYISQNALNSITISNDSVQEQVIDLGLVSSFEECNQLILPHIKAIANNENSSNFLDYKDPLGTPQQLEIAKQWLKTQGVYTEVETIVTVSGAQNGLATILISLFSPGDRIAIDRYTYSNFIELATLLHLELVPVDFDAEGMLPHLLEIECKKKKIDAVFFMPSCNNPIGFQMSEQRRRTLAHILKKEHLWIIEDDIHSFLTTYHQKQIIPTFHSLLPDQTLYLAGMTKFICSGFRVAYLVFPARISQLIRRTIFNTTVKTSGFDAAVISHVLSSDTPAAILSKKQQLTEEANVLFDKYFHLPRPSNPLPYYRIIPINSEITQQQIEEELLQKGLRIYHSNRFTTVAQKEPFIRVALSSNSLEILDKGLEILAHSLTSYL